MINTYNESDLHKELKNLYCPKNGKMEAPVLGSVCDILYDQNQIIEIQTSNLSALRLKLQKFLPNYKVKIVYPIIVNSFIVSLDKEGKKLRRRRSPKHGCFFQIFRELSGLYHLIGNNNLSIKIVYIDCEIIKQYGVNFRKNKRHRNRASIINKKLLDIISQEDYKNLMEITTKVLKLLPKEFTNKDLKSIGAGVYASYTSWFFKKASLIERCGKVGNYNKYIQK